MVNDRESNLVNVDGQIARYTSSLVRRINAFLRRNRSLDQTDKNQLQAIRDRIKSIETEQSAIFIREQKAAKDKELTQEELLQRDTAAHLAKLQYTHAEIQKLRSDMTKKEGAYYKLAQKHAKLFQKITPVLDKMIEALAAGRKKLKEDELLQLSEKEKSVFQAKHPLYSIASMMGGRYYVFNQKLDPLALTNSDGGSCYGYVASWAKQITIGKSGADFLRPNREVREKQINQFYHEVITETKQATFLAQQGSYLYIANQLLEKMDSTSVYGLNLYKDVTGDGHRIGLRKIAATGEIECYDPNYGVFAFKDEAAFRAWFIALLGHYNTGGSITVELNKIGTQPFHTSSFLPDTIAKEVKIPALSLPMIKLTEDNSKTCKKKLNQFYENIQLAGIGMLQGSIEKENDSIIQKQLSRHENSYQAYLKQTFFPKEELKIAAGSKDEQHTFLKEKAYEVIEQQIAASSSSDLKNFLTTLKKQIAAAPQAVAFEILINHVLSQKPSKKLSTTWAQTLSAADKECVMNLSKKIEISPFMLTLLQEKLLLEIATVAASFLGVPKYKGVNDKIKSYLEGKSTLTETLSDLQKLANTAKIGFFAKLVLSERAQQEAYQFSLLGKIDPTNPRSLAEVQAKMSQFFQQVTPSVKLPKSAPRYR